MTQLPFLLFVAGSRDLLFGFNQTNAGLSTLLLLFVLCPLVNLAWIVIEVRLSVQRYRQQRRGSALAAIVALLFFIESLAIDYYLLTQVRM